ncbi:MAG: redox-regulated ATPase YchF [Methanosarcinaceae archaeon]|nr:redox-regulated ATPase YchF [Methanosarcinaceae archaeon]
MSMSIGLAGKPNAGKSTFFKSATMADVEIANYPFTTINANKGVAYVKTECPCIEKETRCGNCEDGIRYVPIDIIDVAGLVPDAHKGKGLGNSFLDDLRQAQAIIHVVDASGGTDIEGNVIKPGEHDPLEDIDFLNTEIEMWIFDILNNNWSKLIRKAKAENIKISEAISDQLTGAGVNEEHVIVAIRSANLNPAEPQKWTEEELVLLCKEIKKESKPMMIAANKFDVAPEKNIESLKKTDYKVVFTSAAAEDALKTAAKNGIIKYTSGDSSFEICKSDISEQQKKGLEAIDKILKKNDGTGVQKCINAAVFDLLEMIVVYPVEDEGKWSNKLGDMLPDAYLIKKGSTCKELAYMIHTEIGDGFLYGVDARNKRRISDKYEIKNGDIIKIVSTAK